MAANTQQESKWTSKRLLEWTTDYLKKAQIDQPRLSAEILLAHVLNCQRIELYTRFDYCPSEPQLAQFRELVRRCGKHEPVAYLTGVAHFYNLRLQVNRAVLIPRPETELLVTQAIDFLTNQTHRPTVEVLDLCTGSGCVALALAVNVVEAEVIAADHSSSALQIAQKNVNAYDLQARVKLLKSNLFERLPETGKAVFDLIVANPPYISAAEFARLEPMVRNYEPQEALLAGDDGLDVLRRIVAKAEPYLADSGALMVEVAYNQAQQVIALFQQAGYLSEIAAVKDHLGHQRVVKARKK